MNPDKFTVEEVMLNVGGGHELYAQLWGIPDSEKTYIFLHGGPGSGCNDGHKGYFDPKKHKVILFDQRGCGKSLPYGEMKNNNTAAMVDDITKIADHFGFADFTLVGGSWGSCLALAYAIQNPRRVNRMVLRGIFMGTKAEIDYLEQGDFRMFAPDVWEEFCLSVPKAHRNNPTKYHISRLFNSDPEISLPSAKAMNRLEGSLVALDVRPKEEWNHGEDFDPIPVTIECYYTSNNCFLEDDYIIKNADKLKMPIDLVQGRYDMVCAPDAAYRLYRNQQKGLTLVAPQC